MSTALGGGLSVGLLFALNRLVDLFSVYGDMGRGCDPQANLFTTNINDGDLYIIADHNRLITLSRKYQHKISFHGGRLVCSAPDLCFLVPAKILSAMEVERV